MCITQRSPLLGAVYKHRLTIALLIIMTISSVWTHEAIKEYREINQALSITINEKNNIIQKIESENSELKNNISQLEEKIDSFEEEIKEEINEIPEPQDTIIVQATKKDFKSYMPYTAITNKSSVQYKLQQQALTNEDGIRCLESRPMVAVGTGWGLKVGDTALVTCENGNSFEVVIGDIKADIHTDTNNKTTISNGCRCEFIVDINSLNTIVKHNGNVAVLEKYNGYITNIVKI